MQKLTLATVRLDFSNADGSNRRSEAMMTLPGVLVELVLQPENEHYGNAIAVMSPRVVKFDYVNAERAPYIGSRIARREDVTAIFQGMDGGSAFIWVRFGGGAPTLPRPPDDYTSREARLRPPHRPAPCDTHAFYPDDDGPDWGV